MEFFIKEKLDQAEHRNVIKFLDSLNFYCIEQHPDWTPRESSYQKNFFFAENSKKEIVCFCNIYSSRGFFKIAYINFGPAFSNFEALTNSLIFLHDHFLSHGFLLFSIQLGTYTSCDTELLEYNLNRHFKVKYYFKPGNLWSSINVDLTKPECEILKSFSKGHKSAIKLAYSRTSLKASFEKSSDQLNAFIDIYIKMHLFRKLPFSRKEVVNFFNNTNSFLNDNDKGFIEYIFEGDKLVGGLIIIYQGKSTRYYLGASDPDRRDIPIMHLGLYEAMKYCKSKGFTALDLWGYNHFVDEHDQIFYINRFKKGFSDDFTFFPKRIHFELRPFSYMLFQYLRNSKNGINNYVIRKSINAIKTTIGISVKNPIEV